MGQRLSAALAVSILALAVAVVSVIITFTRTTATNVPIKQGSIKATDLSAGARVALRGPEGPRGKRGVRGPAGIAGIPGLPGADANVTDLQDQIDALQSRLDEICASGLVANLHRVYLFNSSTLNWDSVSC